VTPLTIDELDDDPVADGPLGRLCSRVARALRSAFIDTSGPTAYVSEVDQGEDRVAAFSPMITAVRVAAVAVSLLLATGDFIDGNENVGGGVATKS